MTQSSDNEWANATRNSVASGKGQAFRSDLAKAPTILVKNQARKADPPLLPRRNSIVLVPIEGVDGHDAVQLADHQMHQITAISLATASTSELHF
jgi:hypothetical protein